MTDDTRYSKDLGTSDTAAAIEARIAVRKERLADNLNALGGDLKQQVSQAVDRVSHKVESGVEYVSTNLGDGIQTVSQNVDATITRVRQQVRQSLDLRAQVNQRPLAMLGAAIAAGVVASHILPVSRVPVAVAVPAIPQKAQRPARSGGLLATLGSLAVSLLYPVVATAAQNYLADYLQQRRPHGERDPESALH